MEKTGCSVQEIAAEVEALIVTRGGSGSEIFVDGDAIKNTIPSKSTRLPILQDAAMHFDQGCYTASKTISTGRPQASLPH